jgi:hypothetical protein
MGAGVSAVTPRPAGLSDCEDDGRSLDDDIRATRTSGDFGRGLATAPVAVAGKGCVGH